MGDAVPRDPACKIFKTSGYDRHLICWKQPDRTAKLARSFVLYGGILKTEGGPYDPV